MVFVPFHKTSRSRDPKGKCHFGDINLRLCSEHLSISLPRARESIYIEGWDPTPGSCLLYTSDAADE